MTTPDTTTGSTTGVTRSAFSLWRRARLVQRRSETASAATLSFDVADWPDHVAGQHVDVRLTADDGYRAQRSYSIASAPGSATVDLTVERLDDGEVSGYLVDGLPVGADLELRGPIGGHFVWRPGGDVPLVLIAGGSGLVPLMAMLRHRRGVARTDGAHRAPATLVLSARTRSDILYADELAGLATDPATRIEITLTRERPDDWSGRLGRVDVALLAEVVPVPASHPGSPDGAAPDVFVCGPTGFVEAVAAALVSAGHDPERVRTERFGPTGG